ncbi:hypothetical protein [Halomonas sp. E19]|uniref:hypothetical protein n=1 Tax=Halomonas sp. E19 TaxID=3397247 RepID=UPI004033AB40
MHRLIRTSATQRTGGRLLALLLALLLAMVTLSSHGAMESHQADCGLVAQVQLLDADTPDEHRCASCAALPPSIDLATAALTSRPSPRRWP